MPEIRMLLDEDDLSELVRQDQGVTLDIPPDVIRTMRRDRVCVELRYQRRGEFGLCYASPREEGDRTLAEDLSLLLARGLREIFFGVVILMVLVMLASQCTR